ncbi:ketosteroid isomerase-like enzyme [Caulobacter sp. AP07]|uniref:nuclear transport factor 2 family protein n=1 Tax=Caulobacter sp. AP07 TaxID=1144304 RepID=UPI00027201A4|nr:DUF4440 domain-containing protein [Caulobacter sp. AP07]EJL30324.1 ketosteroid isomerase-like enzyme [Caulobacter sp. AP07]
MTSNFKITTALAAVLAIAASGQVWSRAPADATLSDLLKKQTQAFSEAGQAGDAATLDKYLDPDVVFMNETGEIVTKKDLVGGAAPPAQGSGERKIEVTEWTLTRQGDGQTATATFVDVLTQTFHGQTLVYKFRSTEVWAKRSDGWKMIASQTMNVLKDPPAATLSAADLDAYAGVYQLDPDYRVTLARVADGLTASANGGPATAIKAELRDVLFIPGHPNIRRIMQRDASGKVIGYVSRRDGTDTVLKKIG